jgi:hypothetical protein
MFEIEAKKLNHCLGLLPSDGLSPILDIGSGSAREREVEKPWVDAFLFKPLRDGGHSVVHLDVDDKPGVDVVADIFSDEGLQRAGSVAPRTVLLCNILEHVEQPAELVERAFGLLPAGGHLVISVPRSYPHHRSPIDTMFRPRLTRSPPWRRRRPLSLARLSRHRPIGRTSSVGPGSCCARCSGPRSRSWAGPGTSGP